jgi:hypothetical protein
MNGFSAACVIFDGVLTIYAMVMGFSPNDNVSVLWRMWK